MHLTPSQIAMERLPKHLRKYTVQQDYGMYTPRDHAVWRYVLRLNVANLKDKAHEAYLKGLAATGIGTERIPSMDEMNRALNKLGWSAVTVSGFIPPKVFMELQAMGVLPIAQDIRTHEHVCYTPAPDIIHESAGHAPIVYDETYASYLKEFGATGMMAISSKADFDVYEAVRNLSIVKEDPSSIDPDIAAAQHRLEEAVELNEGNSEAARLTRMHWWTTEYGLIGSLDHPKIFGAGLLSSVGESSTCLEPRVRKIPLTVACAEQDYDITKPQPQLFVCEDFAELRQVLQIFAGQMAFRTGGLRAMEMALAAGDVTTTELDTGLQISGVMDGLDTQKGELAGATWAPGKTGLSVGGKMIPMGYDTSRMVLVLGKLVNGNHPAKRAFEVNEYVDLRFMNGFRVKGRVLDSVQVKDACRGLVLDGGGVVTVPEGNDLDLGSFPFLVGFGTTVVSVFGGPADRQVWEDLYGEPVKLQGYAEARAAAPRSPEFGQLMDLYQEVRDMRSRMRLPGAEWDPAFPKTGLADHATRLLEIEGLLARDHRTEWLLPLEIVELLSRDDKHADAVQSIVERMRHQRQWPDFAKGLTLLSISQAAAV